MEITSYHVTFTLLTISIIFNIFLNYKIIQSNKYSIENLKKSNLYYFDKLIYAIIYIVFNIFIYSTPIPGKCTKTQQKLQFKITDFHKFCYIIFFSILLNIMFYTFYFLDEDDKKLDFEVKKMKIIFSTKIILYTLLYLFILVSFLFYIQVLEEDYNLKFFEECKKTLKKMDTKNKITKYLKDNATLFIMTILAGLVTNLFIELESWLFSS